MTSAEQYPSASRAAWLASMEAPKDWLIITQSELTVIEKAREERQAAIVQLREHVSSLLSLLDGDHGFSAREQMAITSCARAARASSAALGGAK